MKATATRFCSEMSSRAHSGKTNRRAVCLLDPYSLQLDWTVIAKAGEMKSVEIFLNFPIMDINRNVLRKDPPALKVAQMNAFWGDDSWRTSAFIAEPGLFDTHERKVENRELATE